MPAQLRFREVLPRHTDLLVRVRENLFSTEIAVEIRYGSQLLGTARAERSTDDKQWYLSSLMVCRTERGKGYGTLLLTRLEQVAWGLVPVPIELVVSGFGGSTNRKLWPWYRKRGYSRVRGQLARKPTPTMATP